MRSLPGSLDHETSWTLEFSKDTREMSTQYKVLVIEDNPLLRDSIAAWLELAGYTVVVASDGCEGLAVLSSEAPDLIITDVAMPRLNGIEMIKSVRRFRSRLGRVPIVVLTGCLTEFAQQAISAGADRALAKPVDPEMILAQLTHLLKPARAAFTSAS
jgi:CheY-like chemotaxis protein